jgi:hypothetical protein
MNKLSVIGVLVAGALVCTGVFADGSLSVPCPDTSAIKFESRPYGIFKTTSYKITPPEGWALLDNSAWFETNDNKLFYLSKEQQEGNKMICSYGSFFVTNDYRTDNFGSFTLIKVLMSSEAA